MRFDQVKKLPSQINTQVEEGMPLLTPDGKKLFFTRALYPGNTGGKFSGLDIWFSTRTANGWEPAKNLSSINDADHNVVVGFGRDNGRIYFTRASGWNRTPGIYFVTATGSAKSPSELIAIPGIENLDFLSFYVSPDQDVIFISMKRDDSRGNEDIYYSIKGRDGHWTVPKSVGSTINTSGFEISPFLSEDKRRLYFASDGHDGYGDADIFYCERLYDSWETWSAPVNLGPEINSKKFDAYFSIYGDSVSYFTSNRDSNFADIYEASVSTIETILSDGQEYMTDELMARRLGGEVNRRIVFENSSLELLPAQSELLYYIVNKLMLERDIHFHLVMREENDTTLTADRIQVIYDNLKRHGIDPGRIHTRQTEPAMKSDRAVLEILLFR